MHGSIILIAGLAALFRVSSTPLNHIEFGLAIGVAPELVLAKLDRDKDGKVESHEISVMLDSIDANNDGLATEKEVQDWTSTNFHREVPRDEFFTGMAAVPGIALALRHDYTEIARCIGKGCDNYTKKNLSDKGFTDSAIDHLFEHFDYDGDGVLEVHELHSLLDHVDHDDSSHVSKEELDLYFEVNHIHREHKDSITLLLGWGGMDHSAPPKADIEL